jgi:RING-type zinc-finger
MTTPDQQADNSSNSSSNGSEDAKPMKANDDDVMVMANTGTDDTNSASGSVGNVENSQHEQSDEEERSDHSLDVKANTITVDSSKKRVSNGMIEFDVEPIKAQVVCSLCEGLYREPYTTIKCFHTFCKSCLAAALHSSWNTKNYNCCPVCDIYFGRQDNLSSIALPDRTLETLIDKVLFPGT